MPKLQVTISHKLSTALQEMYRSTVEASSEPIDPEIEDDFCSFCDSVRRAVQRQIKRDRMKKVIEKARVARKK